ncbi:uncharacterized protein LOC121371447 [Gigantopelta aegis]|uniref:uncharacterized protein LOC121371447 n=1 Tax=Gigantopelta aegis TaxID=1735272 RepID=UPI001B88A834|nr:uncharacterized protein LOC121371447 [Gigantopelta aegis]
MKSYVVFLLVLGTTTVSASFWDCRNPSLSCASPGTCDANTGSCTGCANKGHDCNFDLVNKDLNDCTSASCQNGASCSDSALGDSAVVCYCPPEYMGATCDTKRFTLTCEENNMAVSLTPEFTPNGGVYVLGHSDCSATVSGSGPYTKSIPHTGDSDCGDISPTTSGTTKTWTRKVVVQEDAAILTTADFIVTFTCTFEGEHVVSHSVTTVNVDENTALGEVDGTDDFGTVSLTASPGSTTLAIGTEVTFVFTGAEGIAKILIYDIEILATGETARDIYEDGCVLAGTEAYIAAPHPFTRSSNKKEAEAHLLVVKYKDVSDLQWIFTVKTCLGIDLTPCNAPVCSKRRRRAVEQAADNSTKVVNYKINVVESLQNTVDKSQTECVVTNKMTAAVVAMAVACFILLVICLVFIVRVLSRRNRADSKENLS